MVEIDLQEIYRQLDVLQIRCDYLEANQRNAESSTAACSAAGGGTNEDKAERLAGREPCPIEELKDWIMARIDHLVSNRDKWRTEYSGEFVAYTTTLVELWRIIEARR